MSTYGCIVLLEGGQNVKIWLYCIVIPKMLSFNSVDDRFPGAALPRGAGGVHQGACRLCDQPEESRTRTRRIHLRQGNSGRLTVDWSKKLGDFLKYQTQIPFICSVIFTGCPQFDVNC